MVIIIKRYLEREHPAINADAMVMSYLASLYE
jgi:hypothetical protein